MAPRLRLGAVRHLVAGVAVALARDTVYTVWRDALLKLFDLECFHVPPPFLSRVLRDLSHNTQSETAGVLAAVVACLVLWDGAPLRVGSPLGVGGLRGVSPAEDARSDSLFQLFELEFFRHTLYLLRPPGVYLPLFPSG